MSTPGERAQMKTMRDWGIWPEAMMDSTPECFDCGGLGLRSECCGASLIEDADCCAQCRDHCGGEACYDCHGDLGEHVYGPRMIATDPCIFCGVRR